MKAELQTAPAIARRRSNPPVPATSPKASATALLTKILVPVDFSRTSLKALDYAQALAARSGAAVHLVHVVEPAPFFAGTEAIPIAPPHQEVAERCEHALAALAAERIAPGLPISSAAHIGNPAHEIAAIAKEMQSDLLVISTHGRTGLKHLLMGSVAERVVREAPCPVLVVREREHEFAWMPSVRPAPLRLRKILVPTDFSDRSAEALRYAGGFAREFGGRITLLHAVHFAGAFASPDYPGLDPNPVMEAAREAAEQMAPEFLSEHLPADLADRAEVRVGAPLAEVPEFAKEGDFDLIVCATHGRTGIKRALLGSVAEGIVRHAPCPVLVVPHRSVGAKRR